MTTRRRWQFAWMLIGAILVMGSVGGCSLNPKPKPTPQPTPTPAPGPIVEFPNLLLRQEGGRLTRGGQPCLMSQAIPCWDPEEINHYGWGGFPQAWIDYTKPFGVNIYYIRL